MAFTTCRAAAEPPAAAAPNYHNLQGEGAAVKPGWEGRRKLKWAAAGSLLATGRLLASASAARSLWLRSLGAVQCPAARGSNRAPAGVSGYNQPANEPVAAHTCGRSIPSTSFTISDRARRPVRTPRPRWAAAEAYSRFHL